MRHISVEASQNIGYSVGYLLKTHRGSELSALIPPQWANDAERVSMTWRCYVAAMPGWGSMYTRRGQIKWHKQDPRPDLHNCFAFILSVRFFRLKSNNASVYVCANQWPFYLKYVTKLVISRIISGGNVSLIHCAAVRCRYPWWYAHIQSCNLHIWATNVITKYAGVWYCNYLPKNFYRS